MNQIILKMFLFVCCMFTTSCATLFQQNPKKMNEQADSNKQSHFFDNFFYDSNNSDLKDQSNKETLPNNFSQNNLTYQNNKRNQQTTQFNPIPSFNLIRIDSNTWRAAIHPNLIFGVMSRILSQNYIISSLDKKNLNLQTDWDKFFIDGRLFRNRVSIMVFPVSSKQTEIVVKNIVEYYSDSNENYKKIDGGTWLPSPDITDEVQKLIDNTNRQTAIIQSTMFQKIR